MYISIVGSPGCGKSTVFRAFSGLGGSAGGGGNVAVIDVPDERLERLTTIFRPRKTVYGRIEVCDQPAIQEGDVKNETVSAKQLQQMRLSDAFILVLRDFDNGSPADPVRDFHTIFTEFVISDMAQIETRLDRIRKQGGKRDNTALDQERSLLEQCHAHLDGGHPLSTLPLVQSDGKSLRGFQFLSQKPLMVMVNCGEDSAGNAEAITEKVRAGLPAAIPVVTACGRLEADLAVMDPEDRAVFMEEYGIRESIRGKLISLAYETLGLISFLTVGEDECRAWPIRRGMSAQEAAGVIHSDFFDKFIRAETVSYEDFMRLGDFAACKKAGVWRLEGKQYIVQDGDILSIRAGN